MRQSDKFTIFIIFIIFFIASCASPPKRETLKDKAVLLSQKAGERFKEGDFDKALELGFASLDLNKRVDHLEGIATDFNNIGLIYYKKGDIEIAKRYFQEANQIYSYLGHISGMVTTLNHEGLVAMKEAKYREAEELFISALNLAKNNKDKKGEAFSLNNYALLLLKEGSLDEAFKYFDKAYILDKDMYEILFYKGLIKEKQGSMNIAANFYKRALEIAKEDENSIFVAKCLDGLANLYFKKKDYKKAIFYQRRTLWVHQSLGFRDKVVKDLLKIAKIYQEKGEKKKAEEFFFKAKKVKRKLK
ncbi:MAG: tetratricopeptide repeat protein [Deltaproteobacteria bacterium]|nr:tetratricopeptide repeat protein [Deltaproteobacteria bacterium]